MKTVKVHFLGAAKTVTGSKLLLETPDMNILIDCGLFQGLKELRLLNWEPIPFDASKIDFVLLTHGHLDHTGYLPKLVKQGFKGKILATPPTLSIAKIILEDTAKINEEEAEEINKAGYSKHQPALPLYDQRDVEKTLHYFKGVALDQWEWLSEHIGFKCSYNGHIIGATFIELKIYGKTMVFSGDIGRPNDVLLFPPKKPIHADYLFMESTYGNKLHPLDDVNDRLIELVDRIIDENGTLVIPTFAVERQQTLMYLLWKLHSEKRIEDVPVYVDSPMGNNVLSVFERFTPWHKLTPETMADINRHQTIITSYKDTWKTIDSPNPKIVIAGSGMVTGGRVLTYLKQIIDNPSTHVLLVGYQAEGTRGRQLLEGTHEVKIYNKYYPVEAQIHHIESLSAHADQGELLDWLSELEGRPKKVFLIHGEPIAMDAFRVKLEHEKQWLVHIPQLHEVFEITLE